MTGVIQRTTLAAAAGALLISTACAAATAKPTAVLSCPARRPAGYLATDITDSARSVIIAGERRFATRAFLTEMAACGGHAKVVAFTSSAAATRTLLDRDLVPAGATAIARRRRVPKLVDTAMKVIDVALEQALADLPGDGTDVLAQLELAGEYHSQLGSDRPLRVGILTDGLSTVGVDLNQPSLTTATATTLAEASTVPALPGAKVTFAGIGKMAGPPPPTSFVDSLKAFYMTACRRTGADCQVVTDLTVGAAR